MQLHHNLTLYFLIVALLLMTACGGSDDGSPPATAQQAEKKLPERIKAAEQSVSILRSAIDNGQVRNAVIIREYAKILNAQKPELSALINNLSQDAGSKNGGILTNLSSRVETLRDKPELFETPIARYQEANAIIDALQPENYNNSLIDVVNVLADMSSGSLPRVDAESKSSTLAANRSEDMGAGSQLIGNPAYGQWSNSGGTSIWAWYGMYAMFRDLTGGRSYGYDRWNRNRDYSYYNDVGRNRNGNVLNKNKNAPKTKRYGSTRNYGVKKKSYGSSSSNRKSSSYASKSKSSNKSSFSKKSSAPASFRNSSSYSRSSFRGK